MRLIWLLGGGALAGGLLLALSKSAQAAEGMPQIEDYPEHPDGTWGPVWRQQRPPGLPDGVRPCSAEGAALPYIRRLAAPDGPVFSKTVEHLAQTESGAMLGRPANTFDARPKHERPAGKALITAWGCFQWNRDAVRQPVPGQPPTRAAFAWEWTADEELAHPIAMYRWLWRHALERRASEVDAARLVRLWHRSPVAAKAYRESGARTLWPLAWAAVPAAHRSIVDRHLSAAGIA